MVFYSPKGVKGSKKEQKGAKGSKKDLSSLLDSDILYVVSLGDGPSSFFFSRPCGKLPRGYFYVVQHGHIECKENCWCHFALIFTLKSVGHFQHELHAGKIFLLRCFQNR